jgi:hypothetical protein
MRICHPFLSVSRVSMKFVLLATIELPVDINAGIRWRELLQRIDTVWPVRKGLLPKRCLASVQTYRVWTDSSVQFSVPILVRIVAIVGRCYTSKCHLVVRTRWVDGHHLDTIPDRRYIEIRDPIRYLQPCSVNITAGENRSAKVEGLQLSSAGENQNYQCYPTRNVL